MQTVVFALAKRTLDNHFRDDDAGERPWLFPQLLLFVEYSHAPAERIQRAIYAGTRGERRLVPVLRPYEPIGSTDDVRYETTKTCFPTTKSHLNLVEDSRLESKLADALEHMPEVVSYAKNQGLNFKIPYTFEGRPGNYVPVFLIRLRDPASTGPDDLLTLVLEVTDPWDVEHLIRAKYLEPSEVRA